MQQTLSVGTVTLISHAAGRKCQPEANLVFNQTLFLAILFGLLTLVGGYSLAIPYTFALPAVWLSQQPGFRISQVWHLSVATVTLQAVICFLFVLSQLNRRLAENQMAQPASA